MISILTATYNRESTLRHLFSSLLAQSDQDFEWVIVDDGSTDNTRRLLNELSSQSNIAMRVVTQANAGKHVAINTGVRVVRGDWVFIVDSDDRLTADAVAKIKMHAAHSEFLDPSGICFRRAHFDMRLVGVDLASLVDEVAYLHPTEAARLYQGDLAYVFKKTALADHPFPVFKNEKFVPELLVWNKIGDNGLIAYFHREVIYLCEYLADGYSANFKANLRRNPLGFKAFYQQQFVREVFFVYKLKCAVRVLQCLYYSMFRGGKA